MTTRQRSWLLPPAVLALIALFLVGLIIMISGKKEFEKLDHSSAE